VPEMRGPSGGPPAERAPAPLSPEERNRMLRAASLRPLNVMVLVIGVGIFATTLAATSLAWLLLPLTLVTYATLVFLGARDPLLQRKVLRGDEVAARSRSIVENSDVSPERRARWLPRGETRQKVEDALDVYRKVVAAIEDSDDVTRAVLDDSVPRLHAAADRLVDVARGREKAAEVARDLSQDTGSSASTETRQKNLRELEERIDAADAEISGTFEELLDLRAKVVRVSIDSQNPARANDLNASLDGLNARLEALSEVMAPQEKPPRDL
jgi:flagellar motility protein MotE (MotC chaperone)